MAALIRFDWAIKKLLRDKANFGILEGFVSELLGYDVFIIEVLESESNKEDEHDKFNRVDILVKTRMEELMLIEIQNDPEIDYFHRILYGASKLVTEYIKEGEGYGAIKKIVSISIIYFRLGVGSDYIYDYHGQFIGRHVKDVLKPNKKQKDKFQIEKVSDIFPRYYILKINGFKDIINNTLDEWIYFLKNSELPENCSAKGLEEAGEKFRISNLPENEQKIYQRHRENRWIEKSVIETATSTGERRGERRGEKRGEKRGEQKGKIEGKIEVAKIAIQQGLPNEVIATLTQLSLEQIAEIRENINL